MSESLVIVLMSQTVLVTSVVTLVVYVMTSYLQLSGLEVVHELLIPCGLVEL